MELQVWEHSHRVTLAVYKATTAFIQQLKADR